MSSLIRDQAASTPEMLAAFGDEALIAAALAFEVALARALAGEGLIPDAAAEAIADACATPPADAATLAREAAHAGTLAIPLVRRLRARVAERHPEYAEAVHRGATSQDVADTALMLMSREASDLVDTGLQRLLAALAELTRRHAATPMLGRTLLQGAAPITFGLETAGWMLGVEEARARFARERGDALRLQFGGASGTLAGLGGRGAAIAGRMAAALGLAPAVTPWHSRREAVAALGCALALVIGAVGKIARDVSLLSQGEVGEARERRVEGRGGSSAMAHKRNPAGCQVALSAALRAPGLAATLLAGLPQEHERGLGGWQAEAPVLADLFELAHGALAAMAPVIEGLEVSEAAMARNLAAAGVGSDTGESEDLVGRALAALGAAAPAAEGHRPRAGIAVQGAGPVSPDAAGVEEADRELAAAKRTLYAAGLETRRAVLGDAWVDASLARRTPFTADFQAMITRYAWQEVWGRPGLDHPSRRLLVIAITASLGRWEEFRLHVRAGLSQGGFSRDELKETLMQTAIYAGVPAANTAFAEAAAVIAALDEETGRQKLLDD